MPMSWATVDGWPGRVWVSKNSKRTFYIRQVRDGRRWSISTGCSTLKAAMKELEKFDQSPGAYLPPRERRSVVLSDDMLVRYSKWCAEVAENTDPNWIAQKERYLRWWMEVFDGRPLNVVKLSALLEALDGQASRKNRIIAIKHLYAWLRQTDQIQAHEDPTLDTLPVPQSKPEQDVRGCKVIAEADFRAVLPLLPPVVADVCRVLAGTGSHVSEILRFAREGRIEERSGARVMCFVHKGGHVHRVEVSPAIAEAAGRLLAVEAPTRDAIYWAVASACEKAGVDAWTPGRFRHTFATNAINRGVPPHVVALSLGHKGALTTLRWYATTAVAPRVEGGYE
jgi:integrase